MHYDPRYVLDEMEWYEINAALKYQYYAFKDSWEQARLIAYMVAQVNSKKKLKLQDILPFSWEDEKQEHITSITKEDIVRLKQQAEAFIKQEQNKNIEKR